MPRGSWLFSQILFDVIIQDWRNLIVDFLHLLRNYIYCLHDGAEFSKTYPSFFVDKASCTRQFESKLSLHSLASLFPIKKGFFLPLRLSCKESSTSNQAFLNSLYDPFGSPCRGQKPQKEGCNRPTRCSEPLRYKVGGPKRSTPDCAGWDRLGITILCA